MQAGSRALPDGATDESRRRYSIAERLAGFCPVGLGGEIAVTGSQPLALTERLTWDTYNLRLVFALNRRWEPDMKCCGR